MTPIESFGTTGLNQQLPRISTNGTSSSPNTTRADSKQDLRDLSGVPERNRWMIPAEPAYGDATSASIAPGTVSNDGRANELDTTPMAGHRVQTLAQINDRLDQIHEQQAAAEKKIAEYEQTIANKDTRSDLVDIASKFGMPLIGAIDGVAELMGKDFNPAGDAATAMQHTKDDYNALLAQRSQLEKDEAELTTQRDAQRDARALNFLTNVSHLTSMGDETTQTLDGRGDVNLKIVDGAEGDSADARYDPDTNTILVPRATVDQISGTLDTLSDQGIVNDDGKIVDPQRFDRSPVGDKAIAMAATIGVHERTHGLQLDSGTYASVEASGADVGAGAPALEYEAYLNQELTELKAGKHKQGFLTVNSDGTRLPREQAEANIRAFQDQQPLPYPGRDLDAPHRGTAGADSDGPGRHAPGSDSPGRHAPGSDSPGRHAPGSDSPGRHAPGSDSPGRHAPGTDAPGRHAPGRDAPGRHAPGSDAPGRHAPGRTTL